jgi:hypothetical protein
MKSEWWLIPVIFILLVLIVYLYHVPKISFEALADRTQAAVCAWQEGFVRRD